jgi:hypothetical protein
MPTRTFPGFGCNRLDHQIRLHFSWHSTQNGGESVAIVTVVTGARLYDIPQAGGLEVYLHHQRSLSVVCPHERGEDKASGRLLNDPLDNDVTVTAVVARVTWWW